MGAGSDWSQSVNIKGLDSGLYRVSKEIGYDGQKQLFYAEFSVSFDYSIIAILLVIAFLAFMYLRRNRLTDKIESKPTYAPIIPSSNH